jgi:NAD-dependent SIR2 family protein deacetylase
MDKHPCSQCGEKVAIDKLPRRPVKDTNIRICEDCKKKNLAGILSLNLVIVEFSFRTQVDYTTPSFERALDILLQKYRKELPELSFEEPLEDAGIDFIKAFRQTDCIKEPHMDSVLWHLLNNSQAFFKAYKKVREGKSYFQDEDFYTWGC